MSMVISLKSEQHVAVRHASSLNTQMVKPSMHSIRLKAIRKLALTIVGRGTVATERIGPVSHPAIGLKKTSADSAENPTDLTIPTQVPQGIYAAHKTIPEIKFCRNPEECVHGALAVPCMQRSAVRTKTAFKRLGVCRLLNRRGFTVMIDVLAPIAVTPCAPSHGPV